MRYSSLFITGMLVCGQVSAATAAEIVGEVILQVAPYLMLKTATGQKVVRTGEWTAYGNLQGSGGLKNSAERVLVSYDSQPAGLPLAIAVIREPAYVPGPDQVIDREQLSMELATGIALPVDCRSAAEYEAAHLPKAVRVKDAAELKKALASKAEAKRVILYGSTDGDLRPYEAAKTFKSSGITDLRIYTGGLLDWRKAGRAVYATPAYLNSLLARGEAFRLIDLRGATGENIPLLKGAEQVAVEAVTRAAIFLPGRSYQLPLFLYGEEQQSLAIAERLAEWNYHQDGDFAVLDPTWKEWFGKISQGNYRPGQLSASEIGLAEFRSLWEQKNSATVFLNVKPHRDRNIPVELHIPLEELPERLGELPRGKELVIYCSYGMRSAVAWQILRDNGYRARFLNRTISIDGSGNIRNDN